MRRFESETKGFNFVVTHDDSSQSVKGLLLVKSFVKTPADRVVLFSVVDKRQNKEELAEQLTAMGTGMNLKVEVVLKEREDEGAVAEVLDRELLRSEEMRVDFLVVSRTGMTAQEQNHCRMGKVAEFISRRFRGNPILH